MYVALILTIHLCTEGVVLHHALMVSAFMQVRVKPPPLPPPVSPRPKPRHISVPFGPLSALPNSATPRHFSLLSPVHSSNDHYRSMPHSLDISPVKERRKMRVS